MAIHIFILMINPLKLVGIFPVIDYTFPINLDKTKE